MNRVGEVALVALALFALSCSGGDRPDGGSESGDDAGDGGAGASVSAPSSGEEAAEAYIEGLMELVDLAREVQDPESAREIAPEFEQKATELSEIGKRLGEMGPMQQAQLAREYQQVGQLTGQLGAEMTRIATDPELAEAMSNAMRAYRNE